MTATSSTAFYRVATALVIGFIVLPLAIIIWSSFFANKILSFPPQGYTLDWYVRAWSRDEFRDGLFLSLQTALFASVGSLLLGVPASYALARFKFRGRDVVTNILLAPMVVPGIVGGAAIYIFYIDIELLTDIQVAGAAPGLYLAHLLVALPWTIRLTTAALIGFNASLSEAAASLGASAATIFFRIVLPVIRPAIIASALFAFVASFIDLEKSLFLVGPGRTTLQIAIVNYLEWNLDSTIAAVATVQIAIIATLLLITSRYARLSRAF
ncbi:ABC transporter permease [Bradyrhizobium sp.]|uniref:ABC transporter permease n=1 Tax=Bradyrhizobium sp. TaxID=376 RepID=UPI003C4BB734